MNHILLVLSCNLHWAPYYFRYENILKELGLKYDIVIWNREGLQDKTYGRKIEYSVQDKTNDGSVSKIIKFVKYSHFVKKQLKKNNYDKIVFIGTYSGIPAFLSHYLKKQYKGQYWIDLRDITYEKWRFFYMLEAAAINNSFKTVISSKGYKPFLPKFDYGYIHNIDPTMDEILQQYHKIDSDRIRISYIGNLAYWNSCKEMIDVLANDERFIMNFIGPNYELIQDYCKKKIITNVSFHGRFKREETVCFYNNTDIIYNIYGNDTVNVRTALSNKLYYALKFELPIIVSSNTYMEKFAKKYNIGISFENKRGFADKLYNWYSNFDKEKHYFDVAWKKVKEEDKKAIEEFKKFIV
jgi:hypothetical protein